MDTTLIGSDTINLLSRVTGQNLRREDLSPPILFLAPLVSLLTGVMFADKTVTDEEKQRWQKTIKQFIPSEFSAVELTKSLSKGIREHKIYAKLDEMLKLTQSLSTSERLLLIGLGYEMSAADGQMDALEKQYLQAIAKHLDINPGYLTVLESGFTNQKTVSSALDGEVRSLLDPARFHQLDTMFVKAASELLAALPNPSERSITQSHSSTSYAKLREFQAQQKQLEQQCYQLHQVIQACVESDFLSDDLVQAVGEVSTKLQSQRFRLAVVGEFSQGKSTLLNALLGEEIQPTRAIPCSGTVTILKHGGKRRVICRYKDGHEEEISIDCYKDKAAIPKEVAQEKRLENLADSELDEIIFEHPDLSLCQSGVEIIDSPGLNEHPDRTAVTQRLLKDTDAAIFLTNAMRLLPEREKELIQDVRLQLNGHQDQEPADNLFMLVNFFDLIEEEEDRQDIVHRLENFVRNENLLPLSEGRVHYISAKAALKAASHGAENEYARSFQSFTRALEQFLTVERGALKISQAGREINRLLEASLDGLTQAELSLDGKVNLSEAEKQKILDQVGEASGRDVKIRRLANQLSDQVVEQTINSWNAWVETLGERLGQKSQHWHSEHSPVWSQNQLIQDYTDQFIRDLSQEIDDWSSSQFVDIILRQHLKELDANIYLELGAIQAQFKAIDLQVNTDLSKQLNLAITEIGDDFTGAGGFLGGIGAGGALATALFLFTPIGIITTVLAALATAVVGSFGFGMLDFDGLRNQIKDKVFELGFQKFNESVDKVHEKLDEIITSTFDHRVEAASRVIAQAIVLYENLLEQQEIAHTATLEQREQQKSWIFQKHQELKQIRQRIEHILNSAQK